MRKEEHSREREERFQIIRNNMPFYLTGLILIFVIKYFYSRAGAPQLLWLLAPTAGWVSLLSGIPFEYIQKVGYVNHEMKILIAPSCSGMQFLLIAAAMLLFSFVHLAAAGDSRCHSRKTAACGAFPGSEITGGGISASEITGDGISGFGIMRSGISASRITGSGISASEITGNGIPGPEVSGSEIPAPVSKTLRLRNGFAWIGISLVLSYFYTVFVNGLRIIAAIYLPLFFERMQLYGDVLTPDSLHTAIGTVVYFAALLTLYRLAGFRFYPGQETSLVRRCLPPVFWYFFIVLVIPFLNRAYEKNGVQFITFAVLVTLCCCGILLVYCAGILLRKRQKTPGC